MLATADDPDDEKDEGKDRDHDRLGWLVLVEKRRWMLGG